MKQSAVSIIAFAAVVLCAAFGAAQTDLSDEELLRVPIERRNQFIERDGQMIPPMDVI